MQLLLTKKIIKDLLWRILKSFRSGSYSFCNLFLLKAGSCVCAQKNINAFSYGETKYILTEVMVPPGRVELPLPKEEDFESTASTNSATGALYIDIVN